MPKLESRSNQDKTSTVSLSETVTVSFHPRKVKFWARGAARDVVISRSAQTGRYSVTGNAVTEPAAGEPAPQRREPDTSRLSVLLDMVGVDLLEAANTADDDELVRIAERIASVLPHDDPAAEAIGPVYDTSTLTKWLGVSRQALSKRARSHGLLAMKTSDGVTVFPAWQFDADGSVRSGVAEALRELAKGGMDDFTHVLWFRGRSPELDDLSAEQWLTEHRDPEPVVRAARHTAARWSR